jgi:hypothetical protein
LRTFIFIIRVSDAAAAGYVRTHHKVTKTQRFTNKIGDWVR